MYTTLVSVEQLQQLQAGDLPLMVFDCSFDLMKPESGPAQYLDAVNRAQRSSARSSTSAAARRRGGDASPSGATRAWISSR